MGGDEDLWGGMRGRGEPPSQGRSQGPGRRAARGWARGGAARREDGAPQPYLPGPEGHFAVLGLAELRELAEDGGQLLRQGRVWATELILRGRKQNPGGVCPADGNVPAPSSAGVWLPRETTEPPGL